MARKAARLRIWLHDTGLQYLLKLFSQGVECFPWPVPAGDSLSYPRGNLPRPCKDIETLHARNVPLESHSSSPCVFLIVAVVVELASVGVRGSGVDLRRAATNKTTRANRTINHSDTMTEVRHKTDRYIARWTFRLRSSDPVSPAVTRNYTVRQEIIPLRPSVLARSKSPRCLCHIDFSTSPPPCTASGLTTTCHARHI